VVEMRKVVERALLLRDLCHEHLARSEGDTYLARSTLPVWGSVPFAHVKRRGYVSTAWRDVGVHRDEWSFYFNVWHRGSLDRQINDLAANLPPASRKKLGL
jgi:hypothetical protein